MTISTSETRSSKDTEDTSLIIRSTIEKILDGTLDRMFYHDSIQGATQRKIKRTTNILMAIKYHHQRIKPYRNFGFNYSSLNNVVYYYQIR